MASNVLQTLPGGVTGNKYKFAYRARTAAGRLAQQGYVRFVERKGMKYVEITERGKQALSFETQKISLMKRTKKRWDGCWRMVIFDIPERKRNIRVQLRMTMQGLGFLRLQDSVWIFPYDCEEVITLLKAELQIGKDVLYVIAEQIENDKPIKKHFNLR
jgi:DNA-binding transcriptional regulator PaaX